MTDEALDLPDITFEYTCEALIQTGTLSKHERHCGQPATHAFGYKHAPDGCNPEGDSITTCRQHSTFYAVSLAHRTLVLRHALDDGTGADCIHCGAPLTRIEDAGTKACLHP